MVRRADPALGAEIATRMGWTWVVMGEGPVGAARLRKATSSEASAGDLTLAGNDLRAARRIATELNDDLARADVERHEAFLALQQGRPDVAGRSARRSLEAYRCADRAWEAAASLVLAAYAALMVGDTATATREATVAAEIVSPIDDAWALVHALREAAEKSRVLGFPGQEALHLASLCEIERQLGNDARAVRTLHRAIGAGPQPSGTGRRRLRSCSDRRPRARTSRQATGAVAP